MGKITSIKIRNGIGGYKVFFLNDIVIKSNKNPNNRPHWVVGCSLDYLKKYYNINRESVNRVDEFLTYKFIFQKRISRKTKKQIKHGKNETTSNNIS